MGILSSIIGDLPCMYTTTLLNLESSSTFHVVVISLESEATVRLIPLIVIVCHRLPKLYPTLAFHFLGMRLGNRLSTR